MKCPHCQAENEFNEKFCGDCGTALASAVAPTCPECGVQTIPDTAFCMECGADLASGKADSSKVESAPPPAQTFCSRCGTGNNSQSAFCSSCGQQLGVTVTAQLRRGDTTRETIKNNTSGAWWLLPIFMAWIGGIIAYMVIRDDDKDKAKHLLIAGLIMTVFWFVANIALAVVSYSLSW